jgi:hypothetical protein
MPAGWRRWIARATGQYGRGCADAERRFEMNLLLLFAVSAWPTGGAFRLTPSILYAMLKGRCF